MYICYCEGLTDKEINEIININNINNIDELINNCGAGNCCQSCVIDLQEILKQKVVDLNQPPLTS